MAFANGQILGFTREREFPLAPCLVPFPCFLLVSLQHPLVSFGNSVEIINFPGSEPSLRLVWAPNQPNRQNRGILRVYLENPGYTWKIPA